MEDPNIKVLNHDGPNILLSPKAAVERGFAAYEKYGQGPSVNINKFKVHKELWIAGMFSLGVLALYKKFYWLRPAQKNESTPDIYAIHFNDPSTNDVGVSRDQLMIEVLEYEKHSEGSIASHIIEKKLSKKYPDNYTLLCYAYGNKGSKINPREIIEEIAKSKPSVAEIWIMFKVKGDEYGIISVYPDYASIIFNYKEVLNLYKETRLPDFLTQERGTSKKLEFRDKGKARLPI